jgi:hypothetical protein
VSLTLPPMTTSSPVSKALAPIPVVMVSVSLLVSTPVTVRVSAAIGVPARIAWRKSFQYRW